MKTTTCKASSTLPAVSSTSSDDALIKKCDEATSKAELECARAELECARARGIEAASDRAFGELKRQSSELLERQVSQIAACSDWRVYTSSSSAGAGAGGAGGDDDAEAAALAKARKAKTRLRHL